MEKKELRRYIKQEFSNRLENEKKSLLKENDALTRIIVDSEAYCLCDIILSYSALPDEVNLYDINAMALLAGKTVALPRISRNGKKMAFYYSKSKSQRVKRGYCGIFEPDWHWKKLSFRKLKNKRVLVLVPGRAFDKDGYRLGRGKGFYDKYLTKLKKASCKSLDLCGVAFKFQVLDKIPVDDYDIKLDSVYFLPSFE